MNILQKVGYSVAAISASIAAPAALAFDTTDVTTYISGAMTTGVTAIGAALLVIAATAIGFKWGKAMLFG